MGIPIPEEYGGAGADTLAYAIAIEELTRIDSLRRRSRWPRTRRSARCRSAASATERADGASGCPTSPPARSSRAFGLTEPGAGSDAGATQTRADLRRRTSGSSTARRSSSRTPAPTSPALRDDHRAAPARTRSRHLDRPERHARLRDLRADEEDRLARLRHARARRSSDCRVPADNLLGPRGEGFRSSSQILDGGRISVAAMGVGLAQGALEQALALREGARAVRQADRRFQAVQFKLADMATEIEAGRQLVYKAAWLKDQGRPFAHEAAMAKLYTGILSNRVANDAAADPRRLRLHGRVPDLALLPRRRRSSRSARARTRCSGW